MITRFMRFIIWYGRVGNVDIEALKHIAVGL